MGRFPARRKGNDSKREYNVSEEKVIALFQIETGINDSFLTISIFEKVAEILSFRY